MAGLGPWGFGGASGFGGLRGDDVWSCNMGMCGNTTGHNEMNRSRMSEAMDLLHTHLGSVDELALVVLKGHLVIEKFLDRIISRFVFHPEMLKSARLTFAQQVSIARSMSLDEHANSMWDLIKAINALRNDLTHSLDSPKRQARLDCVLTLFSKEDTDSPIPPHKSSEAAHIRIANAIALSVGFLSTFEAEVERFKEWVGSLDSVVNPHRHEDGQRPDAEVRI